MALRDVADDTSELGGEIRDELVQLVLASCRGGDGEIAAALREHVRETVMRLDHAFHEHDVLRAHDEASCDHSFSDVVERARASKHGRFLPLRGGAYRTSSEGQPSGSSTSA